MKRLFYTDMAVALDSRGVPAPEYPHYCLLASQSSGQEFKAGLSKGRSQVILLACPRCRDVSGFLQHSPVLGHPDLAF
jgi:hypothetical protein